MPIDRNRLDALKQSQAIPRAAKAPAPVQPKLPRTVEELDQVIRASATAGELAEHMAMFEAFRKRASRIAWTRTAHGGDIFRFHKQGECRPPRKNSPGEWDDVERRTLRALWHALEWAPSLPTETPTDEAFWNAVENQREAFDEADRKAWEAWTEDQRIAEERDAWQ
jgi:hypothetical protein